MGIFLFRELKKHIVGSENIGLVNYQKIGDRINEKFL